MDGIHHKVGRWPGWDLNLGLRAKCFFLSVVPAALLAFPLTSLAICTLNRWD